MLESPKLKYLKTFIISGNKIVRLFRNDEKYLIEIIGKGYTVKFLAGKTLKKAEERCRDFIKKIETGRSALEPFLF
ncbi:MAG: hypothetical protein ACFFCD_07755 [Promethearchaeota archaeon]